MDLVFLGALGTLRRFARHGDTGGGGILRVRGAGRPSLSGRDGRATSDSVP